MKTLEQNLLVKVCGKLKISTSTMFEKIIMVQTFVGCGRVISREIDLKYLNH